MSIGTILLIVLVLILLGVLPVWPHARSWGYGPSGIVGVIVVILIVLVSFLDEEVTSSSRAEITKLPPRTPLSSGVQPFAKSKF